MPISLRVRTLFILSLFSYPKMIIGNRPKLREDLSHVGFKSPHDFLEKNTKHLKREQVISIFIENLQELSYSNKGYFEHKVYMCVMYLSLKDKKVNFCPFTLHCSKFHMRSNS